MRDAFILLHVDGVSTVQTIIDLSRLPQDDALQTLASLIARGVLELRAVNEVVTTRPVSGAFVREERWTFSVEGESPTGVRGRALAPAKQGKDDA